MQKTRLKMQKNPAENVENLGQKCTENLFHNDRV